MLDPSWPATPVVLWIAFGALVVLMVLRAIRRDRHEYQRFKRYRLTTKRQAMFRRWLGMSALLFGGSGLVMLALGGAFVEPLLTVLRSWIPVEPWMAWTALGIAVAGAAVLSAVAMRAMRRTNEPMMTVGDIRAMIPRNRQEVTLGALMSLSAGVFEELTFRLALPAVLYGASGSAIVAVAVSVLLFGALHVYQGVAGVIGTTIIGAFLFLTYVTTGSILAPIVLHALINLRSFVVLPMALYDAHRIDGRQHPRIPIVRSVVTDASISAAPGDSAVGGGDAAVGTADAAVGTADAVVGTPVPTPEQKPT